MTEKTHDNKSLRTRPVKERFSKVSVDSFASPPWAVMSVREFLKGLPQLLAGKDMLAVAEAIASASRNQKEVIAGLGAHVIKVGLNPVLISWMEKGFLTGLALNGAGAIHDVEVALWGKTSEDVGPALDQGMFGVAEETAEIINMAVIQGAKNDKGFGRALGEKLLDQNPPFARQSLMCQAVKRDIPVTVHVALGTDIVHMHPGSDGGAIGKTSMKDFHLLASRIANLEGGVYLNVGSAVLLPEIFLKALNLARNRGNKVNVFTTVNMDFIKQYRPTVNVVERPVRLGGEGYQLIGHHELNLPLLTAAVMECIADSS